MNKEFNFTGIRYHCLIGSAVLILVGIISIIAHGGLNYGIDFSGGTKIIMKFARPVTVVHEEAIRQCLDNLHLQGSVQSFAENGIMLQTKGSQYSDAVVADLLAARDARAATGGFTSEDEVRSALARFADLGVPDLVLKNFAVTDTGESMRMNINQISADNLALMITKILNEELASRIKTAVGTQLEFNIDAAANAGKVDINSIGDTLALLEIVRPEVARLMAAAITSYPDPVTDFAQLDPVLQPLGFDGAVLAGNFVLDEPDINAAIQLNLNTTSQEKLQEVLAEKILAYGAPASALEKSAAAVIALLDEHGDVIPDLDTALALPLHPAVKTVIAQRFFAMPFIVQSVEMVGPRIGHDLREKALYAVVFALAGILIYISWRFQFKYAIGAIVALTHDVLITVGLLSLFNREIDLTVVAAILTIIGYSLNDTIIVYDRIRERFRTSSEKWEVSINTAINLTLSRTIKTSITTLLAVVAILLFGSMVTVNFAFTIVIGILVGTYSSIFIAAPVLIEWHNHFDKRK